MKTFQLRDLLRRLSAGVYFLVQKDGVAGIRAAYQNEEESVVLHFLVSGKDVRVIALSEIVNPFHPNICDGQKDLDFLVKEMTKQGFSIPNQELVKIDIYEHSLKKVGLLVITVSEQRLVFYVQTTDVELIEDLNKVGVEIRN